MNPPPLADTQQEFFGALKVPLRGSSRRSTELPASDQPHSPDFLATAHRLIRRSPTLEPAECLELYHRQYWFRILDSIEEDFPGLIRLLGRERFWEVIEAYLQRHPSTSFTLRHLGSRLPGFINEFLPPGPERKRAVAVADIEWARMVVFEAPGLPEASPEQVAGGVFTLQPHLVLLRHPCNAAAWLDDEATTWRDAPESVFHTAVWRTRSGGARHASLDPGAAAMLARLARRSLTLDDWLEACADFLPDEGTLSSWFTNWRDHGWFALPDKSSSSSNHAPSGCIP